MFKNNNMHRLGQKARKAVFGPSRAALWLVMSAGLMSGTASNAQSLCSNYVVESGDTLSLIAISAGVAGGYQVLFDANANILSDPNLIEIGDVLQIPCVDGSLPQSGTVRTAQGPSPTTSTPNRPIRIVTATGYAPFTDEGMENGGIITRMVNRSLELGNPDQDYHLAFVNDWGSHLETLLPIGAADMVFPWFRPDCSKVENLSEASAYRCNKFNHSDPFYEALVGFYTLNGSSYADADTYSDLQGARFCRPLDWFTFDLEAEKLMPPNIELNRPVPQSGCWQLLLNGEVDVVTYDALPAEEDYRELGLEGQISQIGALTSKQTLHIFVSKDNAFANEALPIINAGLKELRLSGEWFSIVREGISKTIEE